MQLTKPTIDNIVKLKPANFSLAINIDLTNDTKFPGGDNARTQDATD